jgi:hypothetical protein
MVRGRVAEDEAVPKAVARTLAMLATNRNGRVRVKMTENIFVLHDRFILQFYSTLKRLIFDDFLVLCGLVVILNSALSVALIRDLRWQF